MHKIPKLHQTLPIIPNLQPRKKPSVKVFISDIDVTCFIAHKLCDLYERCNSENLTGEDNRDIAQQLNHINYCLDLLKQDNVDFIERERAYLELGIKKKIMWRKAN